MVFRRLFCLVIALAPLFPAGAQDNVIRTESRVVLVDAVVTDKKGNYVRDLKQKDFRVWEDNKEQVINSFTFEADAASPANDRKHYLVLFFDNSTSSLPDQKRARDAAIKFIDANSAKNRLMAVVEFSSGLRVTQNFTDDADRLKQVVSGVKFSSLSPNQGPAALRNLSTRSLLLALRDLAKGLAAVPGRKTLVFISSGFPLNQEGFTELNAAIDACNRANVAVYPIDIRGLIAPGAWLLHPIDNLLAGIASVRAALDPATYVRPAYYQGKGGSKGGGSTGGGNTGGGSRNPSAGSISPPSANPRIGVLPPLTGAGNQQVLQMLASGTGGFVILNSNDLLSGMEKIGKEQNEYYLLGYTPSKELEPGACHTIKVKVDQGANVRFRTGYCDVKPKDILAGTPTERDLENRAKGDAPSTIKATMQAPFLYVTSGIARVNLTLDVPPGTMVSTKEKGKFRAAMNVIGIVSMPDGSVAARFSDNVKRDFDDKKLADAFEHSRFHYEKQFEVAPGTYSLKVVFNSSAENFGKLETPLVIDKYENTQFLMSGLVLSKNARSADTSGLGAGSLMLEDRVPLIVNGVEIIPSGTSHFSKSDRGYVYGELYEPAFLAEELKEPVAVGVQMFIIDRKTRAEKFNSGLIRLDPKPQPGNPSVPFGLKIDFSKLDPGSYQIQVASGDSSAHKFTRAIDFELEP